MQRSGSHNLNEISAISVRQSEEFASGAMLRAGGIGVGDGGASVLGGTMVRQLNNAVNAVGGGDEARERLEELKRRNPPLPKNTVIRAQYDASFEESKDEIL